VFGHFPRVQNVAQVKQFLETQLSDALGMLRRMVDINSYTANIDGVNHLAEVTAEYFAPLGFETQFVPSKFPKYGKHLVMRRPGKSCRNIALISHLDTVFPPEEEERNNFHWRLGGRGIHGRVGRLFEHGDGGKILNLRPRRRSRARRSSVQ